MMGNVIEMIYPDLSKIEQRFDVAGRLEWFKNKRGQEITYSYDSDGRLIIKTLPEGTVDFSYDDKDRLSEVSGPGYRYQYDYGVAFVGGNSPLVKETNLDTGLWTEHIYDTNGLPQRYYDSLLWEKGYQYNFTSGWTHPGLTKCEKRCVDIHEATPSHVNAGAMNFAAAELQGYTYEKLCLEYEMGINHQWRWPFR